MLQWIKYDIKKKSILSKNYVTKLYLKFNLLKKLSLNRSAFNFGRAEDGARNFSLWC